MASYVQDASDEIDAVLGFMYETPIVQSSDGSALSRPVSLMLKRINRYLASGRYIMAVASSGEDTETHAYANRLIREATDALKQISSGKIDLDAKKVPLSGDAAQGPAIRNAEAHSNVDAFYANFTGADGMMFGPRTFSPAPYEVERGWNR